MPSSAMLVWGQLLQVVLFTVLSVIAFRDLLSGENGITVGLLLISLGSVISAASLAYATGELPHLNRDVAALAVWVVDIGAGLIVYKLIKAAYKRGPDE